jgi:hypothetical protein
MGEGPQEDSPYAHNSRSGGRHGSPAQPCPADWKTPCHGPTRRLNQDTISDATKWAVGYELKSYCGFLGRCRLGGNPHWSNSSSHRTISSFRKHLAHATSSSESTCNYPRARIPACDHACCYSIGRSDGSHFVFPGSCGVPRDMVRDAVPIRAATSPVPDNDDVQHWAP